jgi:hypothetical protein
MRKGLAVLGVVVVVLAVSLPIALGSENVDVEYLESMRLDPPENYVEKLTSIVESHEDPYVRERAVFTLVDIAIDGNETEEIVDFLKDVAMNEPDDNVRTAAYANVDLIRDLFPPDRKGSLELSLSGEISQGAEVQLIAEVLSSLDLEEEAILGIVSLPDGIELLSTGVLKVQLEANVPQEVGFDLRLNEPGDYVITVALKLSFDRIDYEEIRKNVYLAVHQLDGEFSELEP